MDPIDEHENCMKATLDDRDDRKPNITVETNSVHRNSLMLTKAISVPHKG